MTPELLTDLAARAMKWCKDNNVNSLDAYSSLCQLLEEIASVKPNESLLRGELYRRLRLERRLTQSDVAEAIGLTQTTIKNIELGRHFSIHKNSKKKLDDFFGI